MKDIFNVVADLLWSHEKRSPANCSFTETDEGISHALCFIFVMSHIHHGGSRFLYCFCNQAEQVIPQFPVKIGQRFIEEQGTGLRGESPGQGDPPRFPTRDLIREPVFYMVDLHTCLLYTSDAADE